MKSASAPRFVIVDNPGCRRLELFCAALEKRGFCDYQVVSYADLLAEKIRLPDVVREGDIVRLESPGRDWEVEKTLLARGAGAAESENRFRFLTESQIAGLESDKGRLWPSRQWFLGLCDAMHEIGAQLDRCAPHRATHFIPDILVHFDKPLCHARLQEAKVAVPAALSAPANFEDFLAQLREVGWRRVFLKLAHGSSASGVVAFQTNGLQVRAQTTTEMVRENGEIRLYNSRKTRIYESWGEVAQLIDALCRENLHVERWFPKAALNGKTCDARVVVIAGRVWGGIARLSDGPLTNLHLRGDRAPLASLRDAMRPSDWEAASASCEAAMQLFPATLVGGVDLVFSPDFRRHAILEINAWGDLLPGVEEHGNDTYGAQIEALIGPDSISPRVSPFCAKAKQVGARASRPHLRYE